MEIGTSKNWKKLMPEKNMIAWRHTERKMMIGFPKGNKNQNFNEMYVYYKMNESEFNTIH